MIQVYRASPTPRDPSSADGTLACMTEEWRPIVAALADPVRRAVYASVVGSDVGTAANTAAKLNISPKKRDRALAALVGAGLLLSTEGGFVVDGTIFKRLLDQDPQPTKHGIDRFIRNGRIDQYPARPDDRTELLAWAADQALTLDEVIGEREINSRLELLVDDFASLRRYLIDAGLLQRDADGRTYRRAPKSVDKST
jgi:hypothetical protein